MGLKPIGKASQMLFCGTFFQFKAAFTNAVASNKPKPNLELT